MIIFSNALVRMTVAGLLLATTALLAGCREFSHYVYIGGAALPEVDGTWQGQVVPVTVFDGKGNPFPLPVAGLKITKGHIDYVQNSGMPLFTADPNPPQEKPPVILTRDGDQAILYADMASLPWIEVTGTIYPDGRYPLKAPHSDTWVDTTSTDKHYTPSAFYPADTHGIQFLQFGGKLRVITPPAQSQPANPGRN